MMYNFKVPFSQGVTKNVFKFLVSISFCFLFSSAIYSHSTQVGYCTNNGNVRIYIEHWHGNVTDFSAATVDMVVTVDGMAMSINNVPATGFVHDTPFASLACSGVVSSYELMSATCGRENIYNDWAFFDFAIPECFKELEITVVSIADPSFVLLPCNGSLYPASSDPVVVEDTSPPNPDCSILIDKLDYACNEDFPALFTIGDFMVTDDCTSSEDIDMTVDDVILTEASCPPGLATVQRIYTFFDDFNKQSNCIQNLGYKDDDQSPTITCPATLVLECGEDLFDSQISNWLGSATADDDCTSVSITNNFNPAAISTCNSSVTIVFSAMDDCGNIAQCRTTLRINDTLAPEITCPDDITLECGDPNNSAIIDNWLASIEAIDQCNSNPIITNNYTASFPGGCNASTGIRTVTFTANDDCRNSANTTCAATITVDDTTPPEFLMKPQDITVECINANGAQPAINAWAAANGNGMAIDDCDGNVTWSRVLTTTVPLCGYTESQTYTFTITDDCGNTSTAEATATVEDTTPPIMRARADITQGCSVNNETNLMAYLTIGNSASDVCSDNANINIEYTLFSESQGCGGTSTRVYLFTATDECGNQGTDTFTFTITDTTVPTWSGLPGHLDLECGDVDNNTEIQEWIDAIEDAMFDACGGDVFVTNDWDGSILPSCNAANWIEFTVTDECGNSRTLNRRLRLLDRINPVYLNCPSDMTVNVDVDNCGSNVIFSTPIVYDQCSPGIVPTQTIGPVSGSSFPVGTTLIRFDVRDNCNRLGRCDFNITVVDSDIPSIDCPSNDVEKCVDAGSCTWRSDDSIAPTTMENCAIASISYSVTGATEATGTNSAEGIVFQLGSSTVCYTVTDDAGNSTSCCFDVIIEDCEAPTIICPEDITVQCNPETVSKIISQEPIEEGNLKMDCNCTVTQGAQTFPISSIQTDEDAVSFYAYGNPDAASANTGFELANTTLIFLHEDTNTGEVSLVVIMDAPLGGGGEASIDFFCLPTDAAVTLSDDGGEITGMSPTITSNFRWGNCCTDGTVIGNVGCNTTFDFIPQITSGITDLAWVTGTEASPIYTSFGSFTEPVRIQCGTGQPECCQNANMVTTEDASCPNLDDGSIDVMTDPLGAPYTFVWSNGETTEDLINVVSGSYTVTITDDNSCEQIMDVEVGLTVTCDNSVATEVWLESAMGTDNCDVNITPTSELFNTISGCGETNTEVYRFSVEDTHGNEAECLASITIEDTIAPDITTSASDFISDCDNSNSDLLMWLDEFGGAVATDLCGEVSWTHDFTGTPTEACSGLMTLMVTFTATDDCGNTSTTVGNFLVEDIESPVLTCPEDIILECGDPANDAIIGLWLGSATATDNCSTPSINNDYPLGLIIECDDSFVTTFTAIDDCLNDSECEATISIEDSMPPVFVMKPQDITVECDGAGNVADLEASRAILGGAMITDECSAFEDFTIDVDLAGDNPQCGQTNIYQYFITVSDECDNFSEATWYVHIEDTTPPVVTPPTDITVECAAPATTIMAWQAGASASDNCGSDFTFEAVLFNTISGCADTYTEVYQFTAIDACGNQGTALASYTIEDTTNPVVECPTALEISCGAPNNDLEIITWLDSATGTDACGTITFTTDYNGTLPSNCGGVITVTFTGADACGNTSSCNSTITMDDNVTPDFANCPDDITVNVDVDLCGSNPIFSTPNVIDNCGVTVAQTAGIASGNEFPVGTTAIEFTATDECGNTEICTFDITVVDTDVPAIACPSNRVVACADEGTCLWTSTDIGPSSGQENCPSFDITYTITGASNDTGIDDASGTLLNVGVSTVCYTITDDSGNSDSCCFDVEVNDCESPEITCPPSQTFECDGNGNSGDLISWLSLVSAFDNCEDSPEITNSVFNTISDCGTAMTTVYEFTAIDNSNNSTTCVSSFIVKDRTAPSIVTSASDLTVSCDSGSSNSNELLAWLNSNGGATASDVCSEMTWSHDYTGLSDLCGGTGTSIVTFMVIDDCGNTSTTQATFTIEDTTSPVLTLPTDIILECGDESNAAVIENWLNSATGEDSCDGTVEVVSSYPDVSIEECGETSVTTVTFVVEDDCGNFNTGTRVITIEDTQEPVLLIEPDDLILECADPNIPALLSAWLSSNGGATAEDNCSTITWSNMALDAIDACGNSARIPYVFTVTDACGNTTTATADFITEDNTVPSLVLPTDMTVECDGAGNETAFLAWQASITGSDTCSGDVTTDSELFNTISNCGGSDTEIYVFTVTDDCGNISTGLASFTIEDTTVPIITCPEDLELECGNPDNDQLILQWLNLATATDICSTVSVEADYPGELPGDCNGSVAVLFTATDDCGNTSTCTAAILMDDTTDPIFVNCPPADLTVNVDVDACGSNPIFSTPVADDNCDVSVMQTTGPASGSEFPLGTTPVAFTATDACGNTSLCEFNIVVVDSDEPIILCPSVPVVVCTDQNVCTWSADDSVEPSANFENCPDAVITYTVTGMTTASGNTTAAGVTFNIGLSTVCYTITDDSDNSATCCFDVIVEDCESPNLFCPNDRIVECSTSNDLELNTWLNSAIVSDNCDPGVDLTFDVFNTISGCGNTQTEVYLFTATDDFGNQTTCLRSFEIQDNTAPVINTTVADVTVECNGNGNIDQYIAWVEDNGTIQDTDVSEFCNGFQWRNNFATVNFTDLSCNDDLGFYQVDFWAVDDCGNESNRVTKRFIIEDTTDPELNVPAGITLECGDDINDAVIEAWINDASAIDICDSSVDISMSATIVDQCGMTSTTTYTFVATDACGNSVDEVSTVIIVDTTDPEILVEASDLMLECADGNNATLIANWLNNNGGAVASDNCSDMALTWTNVVFTSATGCGNTNNTNYTFTVSDNCGNTSTTSANVIITDMTAPELVVPIDQVEECNNIAVDVATWLDEATASDMCGDVVIAAQLWNTISNCGGGDTETYLFTATDACGNQTTGLADYTIEDTTDPEIVCPSNLALICGDENNDQLISSWINSATSSDVFDCSDTEITTNFPARLPILDCDGGSGVDVTFTVTDACDNTSSCIATITMNDTEVPYFSNCPLDIIVNVDVDLCETNVVYSQPIALDNCDENVDVTLTSGIASGNPFPLGTTTILYTATDDCGNTSTCTFDITVIDSDVPSISCPSNDVVQCSDEGTCTWTSDDSTDPIYNDNCPGLVVTYTITGATTTTGDTDADGVNIVADDNIIFNIGTSEVCYTITDPAGNSSSCCFDVVIEDCEAPTITCNDQLDIACGSEDIATWAAGIEATAMDNCNSNADLTFDMLLLTDFSSCGATFERVYLFTVTDAAGNQSTCTATYETDDNIAPVITDAADLTLECNGGPQSTALQAWLNNNGGATATDVCSEPIVWTNDFVGDLTDICGTNGDVLVTFTATDDCGNTSTTSATFTIEDTTSPVLDLPADITLECGDDINATVIENWLNNATSEDACEGTLIVTNTYPDVLVDGCGMTGVHTITFTVTDACDNSSTDTRTITIEDTTDPEIVLEAQDITLECADANNATLIATWLTNNGGATATDVCSDETLVWTNIASLGFSSCGTTETTLYTFTVEDNCGNTSTTTASVIIEDTTDPILTLPEDQVEECGNVVVDIAAWQAEATATDDCGNVTIDVVLWNTISDCGGTMSEEYLFTATDDCGNQSTGIATYETEDTSIPTIVCPTELVLTCGDESNDQRIQNWLNSATATDEYGCSDVDITHDYPSRLPDLICNGGVGITVTFTATDECGNSHTCTSLITMNDSFDPYFSNCPLDIIVNVDVDLCETNVVYSQPIALDNCDENVDVTLTSGIASGNPFPLGTTTILYTATDDCGNTSTCTFDITVIDSDVPSISCPSNDVIQCTDVGTCAWTSDDSTDPIYNDNCPGLTVTYTITGATTATGDTDADGVNIVADDNIIFNIGTSEVCYTITDPAGNNSSCCFDVVIEDCEAPTITCNDQLDVACGSEDIATWAAGIEATAMDNCNSNTDLTFDMLLLTDFSSCGGTFERVYLFTVTDAAGNQSTCTATYETDDNIAPVITDAADLTLECNGGPQSTALQAWLNNNGGATATDVCSEPIVWTNDFVGDLTGICGTNGDVLVIFTATDDCGNTSTTSATFTIEDTTSPVLDLPADITLECGDDINATVIENWLNNATAEDACEGTLTVTTTYPDVLVDGCGMTGVHTVTFTVTDACDNSSTDTRTITIEDTTDPEIVLEAQDITLECADANNATLIATWLTNNGGATATDVCSDEALVWTNVAAVELTTCGSTGTTLYTFTVEDNCGNTSTTTASVIIEDTTDPVLTLPEDQVEECGNIVVNLAAWQAEATATDDCGNVTIDVVLWNTISDCGGTMSEEYLFTATDDCGNQSTGIATYETEDTSIPTIVCPTELVLTCGDESNDQRIQNWLNSATATDEYGCSDVEIRFEYPDGLPDPLSCNGGTGTTVVFTATDACGNLHTCSSIITMDDTEAPYFSNCPLDMTVNVDVDLCESNVVYSQPIALDDCDEDVLVSFTDGIVSGAAFPLGTTTILYTATDDCGNTSTCEFDITVIDTGVPNISCPSNDVVQCADTGTCTWAADESTDPLFNDNCPGLSITYEITGATSAIGNTSPDNVNLVSDDEIIFNIGLSEVCYTISDPTGNRSGCCFDVVIEDCEAPTISCNDQIDIACGSEDLVVWETIITSTAADNCNSNAELDVDMLLLTDFSSCGNTFERVYLFTVTDEAGNQSTCVATYETDDIVSPLITDAIDLTLECNGGPQSTALQAWLNNNGGATATDVCSEPIVWTNDFIGDLTGSCGTNGSVAVTFTATDDCGNTSITSATFTIEDTTSPILDLPVDITLECGDGINDVVIGNWLSNATAEDACEGTLMVTNTYPDVFVDACGLTGVTTVTFTVIDACGNSSTDTRTITIEDTTDPEMLLEAEDLLLECGADNIAAIDAWEADFAGAAATDICSDEELIWSILSTVELSGCGNSGTTIYTFQVEDNCGNTSTTTASVIIEDTTAPVFDRLPQEQMLECYPTGNDVALISWLNSNGGAMVSDNCTSIFEWEYDLINVTFDCDDNGTRTYRFYVTDECGNVSTADADFIIFDSTPPEITKAADPFLAECNGASNAIDILTWLNNNGYAEAEDICGTVVWTNDYGSVEGDCGTTGDVMVTFTATDECGNASSTSATFTINDTTVPVWEIEPQNLEVNCDGNTDPMGRVEAWLNTNGGGEAEDDCSLIIYTNNFETIDLECDMQGGVEVIFTATDACGNFTTETAMLTLTDDIAPEVTTPATDDIVECDGNGNTVQLQLWLDNHGDAVATDLCSSTLEWSYRLIETIESCGLTMTHTYAFAATDACGNTSLETIADFIIIDETSPEFSSLPLAQVVECDGSGNDAQLDAWLTAFGGAASTDICSDNIIFEYDLVTEEDSCGITGIHLYRFTITDECGNTATAEATFTIEDTTIPVIVGGEDMLAEECDLTVVGNFEDFDFWRENHAGASAFDTCGDIIWTDDYDPANWVTVCGNTRMIDVTFTATDACGNSDSITHQFGIGDVTTPTFVNCPRPPVVVDAPDGWCSSYVNFALPVAEDQCSDVTVIRTDDTGYQSGDLFPVGLTLLTYEAEDACGNKTNCELKIIVNDFHTPPTIVCPDDVTATSDAKTCGVIVNGIAPVSYEDNCPNNLTIIYEITDEAGATVHCGFEDASGYLFPVGEHTVEYTIIDQPLLLITEVIQDGATTGVEITNFGPASMDITCLDIVRESPDSDTINVPNGTVLPVGGIYTQEFTGINPASAAGYYIAFAGRVIDGVSINGYSATNYTFDSSISGDNIYRNWVCDHDNASDFVSGESCFVGSYGVLNSDLPLMSDNGTTVGLQEAIPSVASCALNVSVIDEIAPFCAEYDTTRYALDIPLAISPYECTEILYNVPVGIVAGDININDIVVNIPNANDITVTLTSPLGTTVSLFNNLCSGTSDIDISIDEMSDNALSTITCAPLGGGDTYQAIGNLSILYGEQAGGVWTLSIQNDGDTSGEVVSATLEVLELIPFSQGDVVLNNDDGDCGAMFTWRHPLVSDNCGFGIGDIRYETNDNISLPASGDFPQGELVTEYFEVGTTTVFYTMLDAHGNKSQCSFDVTINDGELPLVDPLSCVDQVIQLQAGECTPPLSAITLPLVIDNCGTSNLTSNLETSGLVAGLHEMDLFYMDTAGNVVPCNFSITILPYEPAGNQINCLGQVNLSLGPDCMEVVDADILIGPGGDYGCSDDFCITLIDENGQEIGNSTDGTNIVDESHIGQLITVKICFDCDGGNCCWGNLLVENKLIPDVVCPKDVTISCNQIFLPTITGEPAVESCEQEIYFSYEDNFTSLGMCEDPSAMLERTWYVTDESNNVIECVQNITITSFDINDVVIPADTIITDRVTCEHVVLDPTYTHPDSTGWATIGGVPISETGDGLCSHFYNWDDQILYNCIGSYEILRKWIIRDMCEPLVPGINPIERFQSIKVLDNMAPQFTDCPTDITVSSRPYDCTADIHLNDYMPEITELCGSIKDTLITVTPGSVTESPAGQYYLTNLSAGMHTVKITVRDQCSNFNRCTFSINVVDNSEPNIVCDQDLHVSLSSSGVADLRAEIFDDGSFDNCTALDYQVMRMTDSCGDESDLEPGESIKVCCADVANSPIQVMLRVWDDADGNHVWGSAGDFSADCMVRVHVSDFPLQNFTCPDDVVITCTQDYENINLTGAPANSSICNLEPSSYVDDIQLLTDCSTGRIIRTWTVDATGQECKQTISLQAADPFTENNIVWPADFEGDCANGLPDDEPILNAAGCSMVGISLESDTFYLAQNVCFKILNTWTVIDWCQRPVDALPSDNTGRWTYEQEIKITESSGPVITSCSDYEVNLSSDDCMLPELILTNSATDDSCGFIQDVDWTYQIDTDGDGSFDVTGDAQTDNVTVILTDLVAGQIEVVWSAFDGCGNSTACTQVVTIEDNKAPNAACVNLTAGVMPSTGELQLWVADFNASSSDNCTAPDDLILSFEANSLVSFIDFDCSDIPNGIQETVSVDIWVTDEAGNQSFCTAMIELQDNNNACPDNTSMRAAIGGTIVTEEVEPVTDVETYLVMGEAEMYSDMTDEGGHFAFDDMPMSQSYLLRAEKNIDFLNGVSTLDLLHIQSHTLGKKLLDTPYKIIAADITNDESITALDLIELRKLILGIVDTFRYNESWRFVDSNSNFIDDLDPFPFDETIVDRTLESEIMDNNFIGIKIGDVNGTVDVSAKSFDLDKRSYHRLYYTESTISSEKGRLIPVFSEDNDLIHGFQFTLELSGANIVGIVPGSVDLSSDNFHIGGQGQVHVSWHSTEGAVSGPSIPLFYIDIDGSNTDEIHMSVVEEHIQPEIYINESWETHVPALSLMSIADQENYILYQNEPNPFSDETIVKVYVPSPQSVTLKIFDASGKVLYAVIQDIDAGEHDFLIQQEDIGTTGLLYYSLVCDSFSETKKMIVIK